MIEMQARTDLLQQFGMTPPLGRRESVQRGTSIRSGPTTVSPAEGAREYFVTAKSARERDRENRRVTDGEQRRRPFETQSQRELLGRFVRHAAEGAVQMERRPARTCRDPGQRHVTVQMNGDVSKDVENVVVGRHDGILGE